MYATTIVTPILEEAYLSWYTLFTWLKLETCTFGNKFCQIPIASFFWELVVGRLSWTYNFIIMSPLLRLPLICYCTQYSLVTGCIVMEGRCYHWRQFLFYQWHGPFRVITLRKSGVRGWYFVDIVSLYRWVRSERMKNCKYYLAVSPLLWEAHRDDSFVYLALWKNWNLNDTFTDLHVVNTM